MEKYAEIFESKRGKEIFRKFIGKNKVVDVDEKFLRLCKPYLPKDELIDVYHAATCLQELSLIHISEPTRLGMISYAVFCLKKKKKHQSQQRYKERTRDTNNHKRQTTQT